MVALTVSQFSKLKFEANASHYEIVWANQVLSTSQSAGSLGVGVGIGGWVGREPIH